MKLTFSLKAEEDLIAIFKQSVDLFGPHQAERYREQLDRAFGIIEANPGLARTRPELNPPVRIHPVGAHLIIYTVLDGGTVRIVRVRHGREDWTSDPTGQI